MQQSHLFLLNFSSTVSYSVRVESQSAGGGGVMFWERLHPLCSDWSVSRCQTHRQAQRSVLDITQTLIHSQHTLLWELKPWTGLFFFWRSHTGKHHRKNRRRKSAQEDKHFITSENIFTFSFWSPIQGQRLSWRAWMGCHGDWHWQADPRRRLDVEWTESCSGQPAKVTGSYRRKGRRGEENGGRILQLQQSLWHLFTAAVLQW